MGFKVHSVTAISCQYTHSPRELLFWRVIPRTYYSTMTNYSTKSPRASGQSPRPKSTIDPLKIDLTEYGYYGMDLTEYVLDVYLIAAMIYAAVPSGQDCRVALHSFGERPRVTVIEAISVIWPLR